MATEPNIISPSMLTSDAGLVYYRKQKDQFFTQFAKLCLVVERLRFSL